MKIRCEFTRLVPVDELKPNPINKKLKKHSPEAIERTAKVLEYQGWRRPITVSNQTGFISVGHKRLYAAKLRGWETVPVSFQDYDDETQETADLVSDNALNEWDTIDLAGVNEIVPDMGPDFDLDFLGIKGFTLDPKADFGDEDAVGETPIEPKVKRGELWILGEHRLLIDDCTLNMNTERLFAVAGVEKVDLLFTSPPYSDLRDYGGGLELDPKHLAKLFDWPAKVFCVNLGLIIREREIVPYWDAYLGEAKARGLKLLSWNIWDKGNASAPAHQQAMFGLCHEWVFVFGEYRELNLTNPNVCTDGPWGVATVREKDGSLTPHSKGKYRTHRQLDSVITLQPQKNYAADYTGHPAQFPVSLPDEYIRAVTTQGDIVADPFLGSGTTLIACEKTDRVCYGTEIDPRYAEMAINRWQKFTGKEAVREDGVKFSDLIE